MSALLPKADMCGALRMFA